jgi:hypothetical protein
LFNRILPAEKLNYEPESFDVSIGFVLFHRLDIVPVLKELRGAVAYFAEPPATSPAIQAIAR